MDKNFIMNTFLFKGLCGDELTLATKVIQPREKHFEKGEIIYGAKEHHDEIGFVKSGVCQIGRMQSDGEFLPLNTIGKYGSFGVLSIFSSCEYPTSIYAKKSCDVFFIKKDDVMMLITLFSTVAMNVITFLSDRIAFLNDKISTFSGGNVTEKLAAYLISVSKRHGSLEFTFNKKLAAEAINSGRASVYRSLSSLEENGTITLDNKKIIINDPTGLERISK